MTLCQPSGPVPARIMIVGEAPGREEEGKTPFLGESGKELTRMLSDAGLNRDDCYLTNVARTRPPENDIGHFFFDKKRTKPKPEILHGIALLKQEVASVKPNLIIALGGTSLWALTGHTGITRWRGGTYPSMPDYGARKVLPTFHPAAILRTWEQRFIAVQDLRRAAAESDTPEINLPLYNFIVRPSYTQAIDTINDLIGRCNVEKTRISVDLETRAGHIACVGLAWSPLDAICIPLMCVERASGFWEFEQEFHLLYRIRHLLTHPNCLLVGQNFLYDNQYLAKRAFFIPKVHLDTMVAHHLCWPSSQKVNKIPKGLDFQSSLYCAFHQYWKDEGKEWDVSIPEEQYWSYNCKDAVITWECSVALERIVDSLGLHEQLSWQMRTFHAFLNMMLRGTKVNVALRSSLLTELMQNVDLRQKQIHFLTGRPLNIGSPKQMQEYFYGTLRLPVQYKKNSVSCDEDSLVVLSEKEPLVRRLVYSIIESRSLGTSIKNVLQKPLGADGRMRCSYNICGTVTFRCSSSEDAFGSGTNLQNLTLGKESKETGLPRPNMRRLIIPDAGKTLVNVDLRRADFYIVVWEADDAELKMVLSKNIDTHLWNARVLFNLSEIRDEHFSDFEAIKHFKEKYYWKRHAAKEGVHATNYGGRAKTVSRVVGLTVRETETFQRNWFGAHPGIKEWQNRVQHSLYEQREVRNILGYRCFFTGRVEQLLEKALAWVPQSTVALIINRGIIALDEQERTVENLLQTHDSDTFQVPTPLAADGAYMANIKKHFLIPLPYADPLTVPVEFSTSERSWGDISEIEVEDDKEEIE